jgi:hypothetical protein
VDFEELIFGMNQTIFSMAHSVRYRISSPLRRDEVIEWSSYVVSAGDEIVDAILCSTVDITDTLRLLRKKYEKASRLAKRVNPANATGIFDVYIMVLDEVANFIFEQEARFNGR